MRPISSSDVKPELVQLPTSEASHDDTDTPYDITTDASATSDVADVFKSPAQMSEELLTLSTLPRSRWANLSSLQQIRMRNKPKEPVQAPKNAPFFLPTIAGAYLCVLFVLFVLFVLNSCMCIICVVCVFVSLCALQCYVRSCVFSFTLGFDAEISTFQHMCCHSIVGIA